MVNTGVTVYSGVTKDSSGNTTSNNTWSSKEYSDAANSASKEEIK